MKQKTRQARQAKPANQAEQKPTRQARQPRPTRTILAQQAFACPNCTELYHRGDRYCGFCQEPLQLQCRQCGGWTKANHRCCPDCGTSLRGSFSFDEKRQLETLRQTYHNLQQDDEDSVKHLNEAYRGRRQTIVRLMVAGVLIGGLLIGAIMALTSLLASLAGMLFLLVILFVFHRLFWGLPKLIGHFWRWVAPGALATWSQIIEEEQELLASIEVDLLATAQEIAALESSIDPACGDRGKTEKDREDDDWDAEEEGEDLENAGLAEENDPAEKQLLACFSTMPDRGKQWLAARCSFLSRIRNRRSPNHPMREDLIQNPDEQPAQPGEEEEDLIEFAFDD